MRVLVLSCSTGGGHNVAARAIAEEFAARGISCELDDSLAFARPGAQGWVQKTYDEMVVEHPVAWSRFFRIGEFISAARPKSVIYRANATYAEALGTYIADNAIDTVVVTHPFPGQALTPLVEEGRPLRTFAVATDYLCLPFWEECTLDRYIVPHPDVIPAFMKRGCPPEKLEALGLPILAKFRTPTVSPQIARRMLNGKADEDDALSENDALPENGALFLVLTGSMGFGDVVPLPGLLLKEAPHAHVVIVTGHNEELRAQLKETYGNAEQVTVLGYTADTPLLLDAADVVLSKPGGLTSTEVAARHRPLVHTPAIPGFESGNADFFAAHGWSARADSYEEAARTAARLLENSEARARMQAAQAHGIDALAAMRICGLIAQETA